MSDKPARHPITLKRIIRNLEAMERIEVTRDVTYHGDLKLDVYHPRRDELPPAVVITAGYADVGVPHDTRLQLQGNGICRIPCAVARRVRDGRNCLLDQLARTTMQAASPISSRGAVPNSGWIPVASESGRAPAMCRWRLAF